MTVSHSVPYGPDAYPGITSAAFQLFRRYKRSAVVPGIISQINSSSRLTMGHKSGITRRIQFSMSAWLSDGAGGFRAALGLRDFAIARSTLSPNYYLDCQGTLSLGRPNPHRSLQSESPLSFRRSVILSPAASVPEPGRALSRWNAESLPSRHTSNQRQSNRLSNNPEGLQLRVLATKMNASSRAQWLTVPNEQSRRAD